MDFSYSLFSQLLDKRHPGVTVRQCNNYSQTLVALPGMQDKEDPVARTALMRDPSSWKGKLTKAWDGCTEMVEGITAPQVVMGGATDTVSYRGAGRFPLDICRYVL